MSAAIAFNLNGKDTKVQTEPDRLLLEVLREDLKLTGTKYGCGEGACGACSVLVDGKPTFSCSVPVSSVEGKSLVTIEGISAGEKLHPVQQAFLDERGFQCGYCTPGMIVTAVALLQRDAKPSDEKIVQAMNSHICRCCAYPHIVAAVKRASGQSETHANG